MFQKWIGSQLKNPKGPLSKWVGRYMEKGNHAINDWTISLLDSNGNDTILEVGIGNGSTLSRLAQRNILGKNYGVDISEEMVKVAMRKNRKHLNAGVVDIQVSDIESLPFKNDFFDKVFTVHTIYFWDDIGRGLSEAYRVLKPNGRLLLSIMDKSKMELMERTTDFKLYSIKEIESNLMQRGFKDIRIHLRAGFCCLEAKKIGS
ncbi:class I SAM-dependent methyltransferase [Peribacillus sp. YIM B13472]|uniref:class I SAM-dependent methyltransferase n=1 Tax=Peribacillus TaxID=2675229 RepID=UPI0024C1B852|nr:class I SAM-dependent methyltransferase [Peribacillus simplex]WHX90736.1 class I SAM-dependent methyltransferase [Peribacillus simplex]